ncbi:MAG: hypothetical protein ABEJ94_00420 [Halorientalis sp.]
MSADAGPRDGGATAGRSRLRFGAILVATASAFVLAYSLFIVQTPLLGALVVLLLAGGYTVWRAGRWYAAAYERRTAAIERVADSLGERPDR